jgi:hypothetical protein
MAFDLNGTNQQLQVPTAQAVNLDTGTLTAWVAPDFAFDSGDRFFFDGTAVRHAAFKMFNAGRVAIFIDGYQTTFDITSWTLGEWQHWAFAYNKTGNVAKAYRDGVELTPNTPTGTWGSSELSGTWTIGARRDNLRYYDGDFSDVATYDRVLTAEEIAALAKGVSPLAVARSSLICYWPLTRDGRPAYGSTAATLINSPPVSDGPRLYRPSAQILRYPTVFEITNIDPEPPLTVGQTGVKLIGSGFGA